MMTYGPWQEYAPGSDIEDFNNGLRSGAGLVEAHQQVAESRLRQQAMEESIRTAAQRFQAQQQYRDYVRGGGDPNQGMKMYGPMMFGSSATGMAQFFRPPPQTTFYDPATGHTTTVPGSGRVIPYPRAASGGGMAPAPTVPPEAPSAQPWHPGMISIPGAAPRAIPPQAAAPAVTEATPLYGADGNVVGYNYGKSTHWNSGTSAQPKFSPVDTDRLKRIGDNARIIESQLASGRPGQVESLKARNTLADLNRRTDAIYAKYGTTPPPPATPSQAAVTYGAPPRVPAAAPAVAADPRWPQAGSVAPAVNPGLQAPTPNSWLPTTGTTASGNRFRLVTPQSAAQPSPPEGAASPPPMRILHKRFQAAAPLSAPASAPAKEVTDEQGDVGNSEAAWRGVQNTQDELDNFSPEYSGITKQDLQERHDQWKKLAQWYDTPPDKRGPKPKKPSFLLMHPTL
jgi:hypothetical protein